MVKNNKYRIDATILNDRLYLDARDIDSFLQTVAADPDFAADRRTIYFLISFFRSCTSTFENIDIERIIIPHKKLLRLLKVSSRDFKQQDKRLNKMSKKNHQEQLYDVLEEDMSEDLIDEEQFDNQEEASEEIINQDDQ